MKSKSKKVLIKNLTHNIRFRLKAGGHIYRTVTHPRNSYQVKRPCWDETAARLVSFFSIQCVIII